MYISAGSRQNQAVILSTALEFYGRIHLTRKAKYIEVCIQAGSRQYQAAILRTALDFYGRIHLLTWWPRDA